MGSKLNRLNRRVRKLRGRRQNHIQITDSSKKADATEVHTRGSADNKRSTSTDDGESSETTNQTPEEEGASQQRELESFTTRKGATAQTYLCLCDDELPLPSLPLPRQSRSRIFNCLASLETGFGGISIKDDSDSCMFRSSRLRSRLLPSSCNSDSRLVRISMLQTPVNASCYLPLFHQFHIGEAEFTR